MLLRCGAVGLLVSAVPAAAVADQWRAEIESPRGLQKYVPHIWHVDGNAHDPTHWKNALWHFSQRIFK